METEYFRNQEEKTMATTKSVTKTASGKRAAAVAVTSAAKAKPAPKAKPATKPEPVAKTKAAAKVAPQAAPKPATKKPVGSRAKKPAGVPLEQRRNYVEVAAYHIAERRGFAPGNPLEDWVQAEAEIDRLIAEGLLGG
jgi:Protein of unknown function (DUF2934)